MLFKLFKNLAIRNFSALKYPLLNRINGGFHGSFGYLIGRIALKFSYLCLLINFTCLKSNAQAIGAKPINYQGRIVVGNANYSGLGQFKFSLIGNEGQALASVFSINPQSGKIEHIQVDKPGSGYNAQPSISIQGGGGSGAVASFTVGNGGITSVSIVNGGSGYTSPPSVSIQGGGGAGAVVSATVANGAVTSLSIANRGSSYNSLVGVSIQGGGGMGALASATVVDGSIKSIDILNGGSGYTSLPSIALSSPGASKDVTLWSNDGASSDEPTSHISVPVIKGTYSIALGDSSISGMSPIPIHAFNTASLRLRVWFNDGEHGFERLEPDQVLNAVPYAARSETSAWANLARRAIYESGIPRGHKEFTAPGNFEFVVPNGVYRLMVDAWGAGGAGGQSLEQAYGGCGGAGAYSRNFYNVKPGQKFEVTVGAGGSPASIGDGGTSEFKILPPFSYYENETTMKTGGGKKGFIGVVNYHNGQRGASGIPDANAAIGRVFTTEDDEVVEQALGLVLPPTLETGRGGGSDEKGGDGYLLITW